MDFNENQLKEMNEFITMYNNNEAYRKEAQQLYNNEPTKLSILDIYVLEEILRFGNNGIYKRFLEVINNIETAMACDQFNQFLNLFYKDESFKNRKIEQLQYAPETLSQLEVYALSMISRSIIEPTKLHEELTNNLEYDELTLIKYNTEEEIRETLRNLFFGQFIHELLELPETKPIKVRQKKPGMIANIDKNQLLQQIKSTIEGTLDQVEQIIDARYVKVKVQLLLGKGEQAFEEYLKYNTNITAQEILNFENKKIR